MEFKIIIPTANRAERIISNNYFKGSIICCPESEAAAYEYACPHTEIITHPDSIKGLGAKRNWILERYEHVFMVDDDLKGMSRLYSTMRRQQMSAEEATAVIQNCGNLALLAGVHLFGFNHFRNPAHYREHDPYHLTGYVNGCGIGIIGGGGLQFDPDIVACNDFYISALNAYKHRMCFIDSRFTFNQKGISAEKGGLGNQRNNESEKNDILALKRYFGDVIVPKKDTNHSKSSIKYGRTLRLPF